LTDDKSDDDLKVGYKRPPRHSRFRPGQSGNPLGRQKGVLNFASDVKATLEASVALNEKGKSKRVSTQKAVLLRLKEQALKGNPRLLERFLEYARMFNGASGGDIPGEFAAEDRALLDAYVKVASARVTGSNATDTGSDENE
jgi:hypothetical protein